MEEASPLGLGSRLPHLQHTHPSFDTVSLDTSQTGVGMRTGMTGPGEGVLQVHHQAGG